MRRLFVFLVVLGVAGVPVYFAIQPEDFDIGPEQPIGSFDAIVGWLEERDFKRVEVDMKNDESVSERVREEFSSGLLTRYRKRMMRDNWNYEVDLLRDESGAGRSIGIRFWSGSEDVSNAPKSQAELLAHTLWKAVAKDLPTMTQHSAGQGIFYKVWYTAEFENTSVRGRWHKGYLSGQDEKLVYDSVILTLAEDG